MWNLVDGGLFPLALLAVAFGLMWMHVRARHGAGQRSQDAREQEFQRRTFRRRMQASGMLAMVAVLVFAGSLISPASRPSAFVWVWFLTALMVMCIGGLGVADLLASRVHYARARRERLAEGARLLAELRRTQPTRSEN